MSLRMHNRRLQRLVQLSTIVVPPLILIGCGSVPPAPSQSDVAATRPAQQAKAANLPVLPPAGSGRGGYYMDDGPGESPPEGLLDTPDAEPQVEPYSKRGNRPYVVFGKQYTPITDERPFKQRGVGSWYGKKFHGQKTSSGEPYDMYKMTAAHPTLPIPSFARVTNVVNGKQVIVRVNDRGPFHSGRIIDLSYTAALKLGYLGKGSGELEVERLLPDDIANLNRNRKSAPVRVERTAPASDMISALPGTQPLPRAETPAPVSLAAVNLGGTEIVQIAETQPPLPQLQPSSGSQPVVVPAPQATSAQGFYLQLGAYSQAINAESARTLLSQNNGVSLPPIEVVEYGALFRLYSGPFATRAEAAAAAQQLQGGAAIKPMIVQR